MGTGFLSASRRWFSDNIAASTVYLHDMNNTAPKHVHTHTRAKTTQTRKHTFPHQVEGYCINSSQTNTHVDGQSCILMGNVVSKQAGECDKCSRVIIELLFSAKLALNDYWSNRTSCWTLPRSTWWMYKHTFDYSQAHTLRHWLGVDSLQNSVFLMNRNSRLIYIFPSLRDTVRHKECL